MTAAWTHFITLSDAYYLTVIALIRSVPYALQPLMVSNLAATAYQRSHKKRAAIEKNLDAAFGNTISLPQRERIVRCTFYSFWRELFDWSLPPLENLQVEWSGIEHLQATVEKGSGIILWESNGFGKRILLKRILHANGYPLCQIHGANNLGGFLDKTNAQSAARRRAKNFFDSREAQFVQEILYLPADDSFAFTRTLLARLRDNTILCSTGDGRIGQKFLPLLFLGQAVPFASGMITLARLAGATILPVFCHTSQDGKVCLSLEAPLPLDGNQDHATATRFVLMQYASLLENFIRQYPEQYRNWHLVA